MTTPEDVQKDYTSRLEAIAATVAATAAAIYAALLAGRLVRSVAAEAIALIIAQGNNAAAALADLHVADTLTAATGTPVLPQGITRPESDVPRLTAAAETVIDRAEQRQVERSSVNVSNRGEVHDERPLAAAATDPAEVAQDAIEQTPAPPAPPRREDPAPDPTPDGTAEVERLAKSEPMAAASEAEGKAVNLSRVVVAYRRSLSPGACQRCIGWAEGGREFPKKHPFKRHHGCTCSRTPITLEDRKNDR